MSHFAKVRDGKVVDIIVAEEDFFTSGHFVETTPGTWIQCSYNTRGGVHYLPDSNTPSEDQSKALRANYPAIGYNHDWKNDVFYAPQPYPSWTLNKTTWLWEPPYMHPIDGNAYVWNESTTTWDVVVDD